MPKSQMVNEHKADKRNGGFVLSVVLCPLNLNFRLKEIVNKKDEETVGKRGFWDLRVSNFSLLKLMRFVENSRKFYENISKEKNQDKSRMVVKEVWQSR